jgi:hypothetical protein
MTRRLGREGPVAVVPAAPAMALEGAPGDGTGGPRALTVAARGGGRGDPPLPAGLAIRR